MKIVSPAFLSIATALALLQPMTAKASASSVRGGQNQLEDTEIAAQTGLPPPGRLVHEDEYYPILFPTQDQDEEGGRKLAIACTRCYYHSHYGFVKYCCDHLGTCGWFYC